MPENLYTRLIQKLKGSVDRNDLIRCAEEHVDIFAAEAEFAAESGESVYTYMLFRNNMSKESFEEYVAYFRRGVIRLGFPPEHITLIEHTTSHVKFSMRCIPPDLLQ